MDRALLVTIVTSAAVGALVSSGLTLLGQVLERRARRREFLLGKAVDLAFQRIELAMEVSKRSNRKVRVAPAVALAADYYDTLQHLLSTGDLPERVKQQLDASRPAANPTSEAEASGPPDGETPNTT